MAFVSTKDNGGVKDSRIAPGRPPKDKTAPEKVTRRSLRDRELIQLARKLKPHVALSITTAVKVMGNDEAKDGDKLRAGAFLFAQYRELISEIYEGDADSESTENPEEVQPKKDESVVFSLKMIPSVE